MYIEIEWKGSFGGNAQDFLERSVRTTITSFFRYHPHKDMRILFQGFFTKTGVDSVTGIKSIPRQRDIREEFPGFCVLVHVEGTQGAGGLLQIAGRTDEQVRGLIEAGRSKKPKAVKLVSDALVQDLASTSCDGSHATGSEIVQSAPPQVDAEKSKQPQAEQQSKTAPQLSPRQRLESNGVPPEKIRGLQSAFAAIMDSEMKRLGLTELPNTLQVAVPVVTEALIEHLEIVPDREHGYRGKVGGYYSGWVTLFGFKDAYPHDESNDKRFWLMDCPLVLDFIGGTDALAHLVRVRQQRSVVPQESSSEQLPSAEDVEQAVAQGLPYEEVIELARKTLEGKKLAELSLLTAQAQEMHYELMYEALLTQLAQVERGLEDARAGRVAAEQHVSSFVLQPDVLERIREMKRQLDALSNELGL